MGLFGKNDPYREGFNDGEKSEKQVDKGSFPGDLLKEMGDRVANLGKGKEYNEGFEEGAEHYRKQKREDC